MIVFDYIIIHKEEKSKTVGRLYYVNLSLLGILDWQTGLFNILKGRKIGHFQF